MIFARRFDKLQLKPTPHHRLVFLLFLSSSLKGDLPNGPQSYNFERGAYPKVQDSDHH